MIIILKLYVFSYYLSKNYFHFQSWHHPIQNLYIHEINRGWVSSKLSESFPLSSLWSCFSDGVFDILIKIL